MGRHPEVAAWLEVERHSRRVRRLATLAAVFLAVVPALLMRALAHLAFSRVEPHFAAAFEQMAFLAPWGAAILGARQWADRWANVAGRRSAARIAQRHGVDPTSVFDALLTR